MLPLHRIAVWGEGHEGEGASTCATPSRPIFKAKAEGPERCILDRQRRMLGPNSQGFASLSLQGHGPRDAANGNSVTGINCVGRAPNSDKITGERRAQWFKLLVLA